MTDDSRNYAPHVDSHLQVNLGALGTVNFSRYLLFHVEGQLNQPHGLFSAQNMLRDAHFAGLDTCRSHVSIADSFDFLNAMLHAEVVIQTKKIVEHGHDILTLHAHDGVKVTNVKKEDGDIILRFGHCVLALSHLRFDKIRHKY